jgi:hypothetical protein
MAVFHHARFHLSGIFCNDKVNSSEEPCAALDIPGFYDDEILADTARQPYGAAAFFIFPSLVGESELFIAFVADEIGALAAIAFPVFVAGEAGVEVSGEAAGAVGPYEKVDALSRILVGVEMDLPVVYPADRYPDLAILRLDHLMFGRELAAPCKKREEDNEHHHNCL